MKTKTKDFIKTVLEVLGIIVFLYFAYYFFVVVACADGTPKGSLYYDLGMHHVSNWLGSVIRSIR